MAASEMLDKMKYTEAFKSLPEDDKLTFLAGELYDIKTNCTKACQPSGNKKAVISGSGIGAIAGAALTFLINWFTTK